MLPRRASVVTVDRQVAAATALVQPVVTAMTGATKQQRPRRLLEKVVMAMKALLAGSGVAGGARKKWAVEAVAEELGVIVTEAGGAMKRRRGVDQSVVVLVV